MVTIAIFHEPTLSFRTAFVWNVPSTMAVLRHLVDAAERDEAILPYALRQFIELRPHVTQSHPMWPEYTALGDRLYDAESTKRGWHTFARWWSN